MVYQLTVTIVEKESAEVRRMNALRSAGIITED